MKEMITIATFNERPSAEVLERRLRDAGFDTDVEDETAIQQARLYAPKPKAHIHVRVPKRDVEAARQRLAQWEPEGVMKNAVRCPECGSSSVQYPQFTRNFLLPNILAAAAWKLGFVTAEYFCQSCQYTWPAEAEAETPEVDNLWWPKDSHKHGPIGPK